VVTRLLDVAAQRRILGLLVGRDLKLRYSGAALGYLWTLLEPLSLAAVYWLVFTVIMGARGLGEQPYLLFLLVGLLPWNWFHSAASQGCKSLTGEAKIVRSANVPREIWVVRVVISKMFEFLFAWPIIIVLALAYQHGVHWQIVFVPVAMVIQFALCLGVALILAPLTVLVEDVQRVVRIVLRIGMYLTPIIYGIGDVSGRGANAAKFAALNPFSGIICLYRAGFWPDQEAPAILYVSSVVISAFVLVFGLWVFRRLEGPVLKEI
jgi:ABC-2 type transport system permease protein